MNNYLLQETRMEYYSKSPFGLHPLSNKNYLRSTSRNQGYVKEPKHTRIQSDSFSRNFKRSLDSPDLLLQNIYKSSIDPLPNLSKACKKVSSKRHEPKNSLELMRKIYSPNETKFKDSKFELKDSKQEIKDLQRYLQEFHSQSKHLLSQLQQNLKKTLF